jgi:hypothetical protein
MRWALLVKDKESGVEVEERSVPDGPREEWVPRERLWLGRDPGTSSPSDRSSLLMLTLTIPSTTIHLRKRAHDLSYGLTNLPVSEPPCSSPPPTTLRPSHSPGLFPRPRSPPVSIMVLALNTIYNEGMHTDLKSSSSRGGRIESSCAPSVPFGR